MVAVPVMIGAVNETCAIPDESVVAEVAESVPAVVAKFTDLPLIATPAVSITVARKKIELAPSAVMLGPPEASVTLATMPVPVVPPPVVPPVVVVPEPHPERIGKTISNNNQDEKIEL